MSGGLPTPEIGHITRSDYRNVYEPAEDTFLLLDALEKDGDWLRRRSPTLALEVGCGPRRQPCEHAIDRPRCADVVHGWRRSGSGCVTAFLGQVLGASSALYLCTDINAFAAAITAKTGAVNKIPVDSIVTHFAVGMQQRIAGAIDVLVFNPPYVVTPSEEVGSRGIEASWAGGVDGREVIDKFLPLVPKLLSPQGAFYLVLIKENRPAEIMQHMQDEYGLAAEIVLHRRAGYEGLCIARFWRPGTVEKQ
ncbi:S-adenosylmethionine-dependent methyltransferase [Polyrhizophydium stewartii]|uniref:S-adenosylmethionine-dependent methyltransferase n=1 Tax=Polyrhizophydium stewartii TaxID=2732419 RepID=A0ABR4NI55_9FUNG